MAKKSAYEFFDYDCDLTHRVIWLGSQHVNISGNESGVDSSLAEKVLKALYLMNKQAPSGDKPIDLILANPGGDWYYGMAIYGAIKKSLNPVNVHVEGLAASMATVILQAASTRTMDSHAKLLIHWGSATFEGHSKTFSSWSKEEEKNNEELIKIYMDKILVKNPDFKVKTLREMLNFDTFLTAQESLDLGLIDEIE